MDSDDNEDDNDDVEKDNDNDPVDDDDDDDDKAAINVAHWHAPEEIEGSTKERLAVSHDNDDDDDDNDDNDDNDDVLSSSRTKLEPDLR